LLTDRAGQRLGEAGGSWANVQQVEALTEYCGRVRERLQTFDHAERRVALEALDIRVSWIPGQPFAIQGSIPIESIMAIPIALG
jgi:hypothetical protein